MQAVIVFDEEGATTKPEKMPCRKATRILPSTERKRRPDCQKRAGLAIENKRSLLKWRGELAFLEKRHAKKALEPLRRLPNRLVFNNLQ